MNLNIQKYGLNLTTLKEDDLEFLRGLRNNPSDRNFFFGKDEISEEQQKVWFNKIDWNTFLGVIVKKGDNRIGYYSVSNVNYKTREADNITIMAKYRFKKDNLVSSVLFSKFLFEEIKLNRVWGQIKAQNLKSIRYAKHFGFEVQKSNDVNTISVCMSNESFYESNTYKTFLKYYKS